jgi:probable rRNA maturation factor
MDDRADAYEIVIEVDPPYADVVNTELVGRVARQVLRHEGQTGPLELSVWITNEDELHTLNRTFRNTDKSTDVLSFGEAEDDHATFILAPETVPHLGDVAISYPHVVRQAEELGHSADRELGYLLAHGILHLLGYDHQEPDEARLMREHEQAALGDLGISPAAYDARFAAT